MTFLGTVMHFITLDVAVTWVTTSDRMVDAADKLTLVSTLLLTMTTLMGDEMVGEAFDGDHKGSVYTCVAYAKCNR